MKMILKYYRSSISPKTQVIILLFALCTLILSCQKLVEVNTPVTSTNSDLVFKSDATAIATLNGIYTRMSQQGIDAGITSMSLYPSLAADELVVFDEVTDRTFLSYYNNSLTPDLSGNADYWTNTYSSFIFSINAILEGLNTSDGLTSSVKNQLQGEALFLRAFCYFYLVNLYGDVPLVLTTDYKVNSLIPRTSKSEIYKSIIKDLKEAQTLLSDNYLDGSLLRNSIERTTPNISVATALLARVYLYNENWDMAELEASKVIDNKDLYDTVPLTDVFLLNNRESIWQLQSVSNSVTNTSDARLFILPETGPSALSNKVYLSNTLIASFLPGDKRREQWIDSVIANNQVYYFPNKYKINQLESPVIERTVILRIAEQYLIRSESRAQKGDLEGALDDLNIIRIRAGLPQLSIVNKDEILKSIIHERQIELFTEWGHRWLDLKRLNIANTILSAIKGNNWQTTDQLFPIPASEILGNKEMVGHQNPGY